MGQFERILMTRDKTLLYPAIHRRSPFRPFLLERVASIASSMHYVCALNVERRFDGENNGREFSRLVGGNWKRSVEVENYTQIKINEGTIEANDSVA